ncbi:MAG TPA: ISL3 family transposase [Planctomycetaceae bacterium]
MHDRQLYEQILGIVSPWTVERVELQLEGGEVHVHLSHSKDASWKCAECGRQCPLYDHQGVRTWRHLDTCQYQTRLHACLPRTECPEHGVRVVSVSWAEPGSHFTALFERLAIDWLKEASQQAVARQLDLSWDEIHGIMERAVRRGLARRKADELPHLGVDEKAFRRGHRYATIVVDIWRSRVVHVAKGRDQASLDTFWPTLTPEQLAAVDLVAMDMHQPYVNSVEEHLPNGDKKIVFDKFHVAKHLGEAVDRVRRAENKELRQDDDDRLVGTKYDWLRNPNNFKRDAWAEFRTLRDSKLKTARAWALKEHGMTFWNQRSARKAKQYFDWWYRWATHSRLKPMIEKAKMLKSRLPNLLTYFKYGLTNATSESLNSKIQWVRYTARGFRNFQNFATAIYFHCGKLDMAPSPT